MKFNKAVLASLLLMLMAVPILSFAQSSDLDRFQDAIEELDVKVETEDAFFDVIFRIVGLFRTLFWIVSIAFIFFAAYLYLFEGASSGKVDRANQMLKYAVIAMIIALVATSIPFLVRSILSTGFF